MEDNKDYLETWEWAGIIASVILVILAIWLVVVLFKKAWPDNFSIGTSTYCTQWVAVESIEPKHFDNGKYNDEMYVVKYKDGTVEGREQGNIEPYRCTEETTIRSNQKPDPQWKKIEYGNISW